MLTLEQAIALATKAHEGQYRRPKTVVTDSWDFYKTKDPIIHENGNKIQWIIQDTFLVYKPYITHPFEIMEMMITDEEKIVAVLHDVFENNKTFELKCDIEDNWYINTPDSKTILISTNVGKALTSLTNNLHLEYKEYIRGIVLNKLATKVKLADIVCNLADSPSEHAKQKYLKALPILLKGI